MPRSQGQYNLPPIYQATPGETIRAEQHNTPLEDIAQALTGSLARDGSSPMQGNLPMGGRKITGLGAPTAAGDAATKAYADSLTPTETNIDMTGAGLIGKGTSGNGKSLRITFGDGLRLVSGGLAANLGAGLSFVSGAIVAAVTRFATQAEAEAGTDQEGAMNSLRVRQAIRSYLSIGGNAPVFGVRAWAVFNVVANSLVSSGNISSAENDNNDSTEFTFATPMQNFNYSVVVSQQSSANPSGEYTANLLVFAKTTTGFKVKTNTRGGNMGVINVQVVA